MKNDMHISMLLQGNLIGAGREGSSFWKLGASVFTIKKKLKIFDIFNKVT